MLTKLRKEYNAPIFIESFVAADDKNSTVRILQIDQAGLGFPSRDYFLETKRSDHVEAYVKYMTSVAVLLGADKARADREFAEMLKFETELANITMTQTEKQDTGALYMKMTLRELQQKVPEIQWLYYFNGLVEEELDENEKVVLFALKYFKKLGKLLKSTPKRTLANYLLWRVTMGFAPELTEPYQLVKNQYIKVLQGVSRDKVRWQKCVEFVNERMGMAVGAMFLRDNFKKESKVVALEMISDIRDAFNEILFEADWMDDETKMVAKEKADAMNERIGYPDFITDPVELDKTYEKLSVEVDHYFKNILAVEKYDAERNTAKLRKPVEKGKWEQDPAVVNAFYNPNANDIMFPAGILQPLFYSQYFPKSLNYGGIGVVIGHEITHGFDDKGRQYDKNGNLRQWWNNETIEAFRKRAECIVDQYSQFTIEPFGLKMNGRITQGENIADNGGLKEAFRAYKKWVSLHGMEPLLPGIKLSHNQLFFLNYAQIWCGNMRGQEALHKIRTSVHSPGQLRAIGPLSNSDEFADAYSCPKGSKMNPVRKCSVW
ncbi:neprilysin-1-like isoform X2 [Lineus longissimus]